MDDDRNWLFRQYQALIDAIEPDGFIFENVTGLLNMEGGQVFDMVKAELSTSAPRLVVWKLQAEEYAVPQRRTRVFILGDCSGRIGNTPPSKTTMMIPPSGQMVLAMLPEAIAVEEALSDLPPLQHGEDGSMKPYRCPPRNPYQQLMRGEITPAQYLEALPHYRLGIPARNAGHPT
jgi:DNA (cytosine-5)-methyltransferase 1